MTTRTFGSPPEVLDKAHNRGCTGPFAGAPDPAINSLTNRLGEFKGWGTFICAPFCARNFTQSTIAQVASVTRGVRPESQSTR